MCVCFQPLRVKRPASEPPSPSVSRCSTPAPSDNEDNEDLNEDEVDSEDERYAAPRERSLSTR